MWTWTRGGGWEGPYPKDELWCDLNAWVLAQWANNPKESEEKIFERYCREILKLSKKDCALFRRMALLSEEATLLGMRSKAYPDDIMRMWVRDEYITFPELPKDTQKINILLQEKDTAVKMWNEIVMLSEKIKFSTPFFQEYIHVTTSYGLEMYSIFRDVFYLSAIRSGYCNQSKDKYIKQYDKAWYNLNKLSYNYPTTCPSLFSKTIIRRTWSESADEAINKMRH